jgi:hypothetical protein
MTRCSKLSPPRPRHSHRLSDALADSPARSRSTRRMPRAHAHDWSTRLTHPGHPARIGKRTFRFVHGATSSPDCRCSAPLRAAPAAPRPRARAGSRGRPAQHHPAPVGARELGTTSQGRAGARCRRCRRSVSPTRPPNRTCTFPRIRLSTGHAMVDRDAGFRQRRFPVEWWLGLFRWPPTARGCGGRDSDIGSPQPRRARRASCLRGWSSGAPSTVA